MIWKTTSIIFFCGDGSVGIPFSFDQNPPFFRPFRRRTSSLQAPRAFPCATFGIRTIPIRDLVMDKWVDFFGAGDIWFQTYGDLIAFWSFFVFWHFRHFMVSDRFAWLSFEKNKAYGLKQLQILLVQKCSDVRCLLCVQRWTEAGLANPCDAGRLLHRSTPLLCSLVGCAVETTNAFPAYCFRVWQDLNLPEREKVLFNLQRSFPTNLSTKCLRVYKDVVSILKESGNQLFWVWKNPRIERFRSTWRSFTRERAEVVRWWHPTPRTIPRWSFTPPTPASFGLNSAMSRWDVAGNRKVAVFENGCEEYGTIQKFLGDLIIQPSNMSLFGSAVVQDKIFHFVALSRLVSGSLAPVVLKAFEMAGPCAISSHS